MKFRNTNVALTVLLESTITVHVGDVPEVEHEPPHPLNCQYDDAGNAVKTTVVPLVIGVDVHAVNVTPFRVPQLIPPTELEIYPVGDGLELIVRVNVPADVEKLPSAE